MWPISYPTSAEDWQDISLALTVITISIAFAMAATNTALTWKVNNAKKEESRQKDEKIALEFKAKDVLIANADTRAAEANTEAARAKERAELANERTEKLEGYNLHLRRDLNDATGKVSLLQKEATDARIELARVQVSLAAQQERAASAEKSLLELQERLAWRNLNAEQQGKVVGTVKGFSGTEFEIRVFQEPEAIRFLNIMVEMLHAAGWVQRPIGAGAELTTKYGPAGLTLSAGIFIRTDPRYSERKPAAIALVAALRAERIIAEVTESIMERNPERVQIVIGKTP